MKLFFKSCIYVLYLIINIKFVLLFMKIFSVSRPISWVLFYVIINLVHLSPNASSGLPKSSTRSAIAFLFGLAPSGVYHANNITIIAVSSYLTFSPLQIELRFIFCCTFRKLTLPRCYLALYSLEPRLSSLQIKRSHSRLNIIRY